MTTPRKSWFITGTSKGFGRVWAEAALARGDRVAATARDLRTLEPLVARYGDQVLPLQLDVTDRAAAQRAVQAAHARFGRLDVVVNNAGYGLFAMAEETSEAQARAQFETNFFGAMWITQAALPLLRAQGGGHLVQVSSIGGVIGFPLFSVYNASKWALEGFSQALAAEVKDFGIKVTLVEPTGYATDWSSASAVRAEPMPAYDAVRERVAGAWRGRPRGEPQATAAALLAWVDAEQPPLRAFLGSGLLDMVRSEYAQRLDTWAAWSAVADAAMGTGAPIATSITAEHFRSLLSQVTARIDGKPLDADLQAWLNQEIGPHSALYQQINAACQAGARAGWLCPQQAPNGTRFGRVFEPAADLHGHSVDVVEMTDVVAPHHVHPTGEIDLVMPQEGDARFEGHSAGWVVHRPGSAHSPAVHGGRAFVLYLLPQGQIQFTA